MSPSVQVKAYLAALPPDARRHLNMIRGMVQFPLDRPVPVSLVTRLIKTRMAHVRAAAIKKKR